MILKRDGTIDYNTYESSSIEQDLDEVQIEVTTEERISALEAAVLDIMLGGKV